MRQFYQVFKIRDTLRPELTWSHYRRLISVENEQARIWYMNEAADSVWSTRQMDRQISTLYYERLLASKDKAPVVAEAKQKMSELKPEQFIHDPFVLEFLNLKDYPALRESDIEQALIDHLQHFLLELGRGFCFVARQNQYNNYGLRIVYLLTNPVMPGLVKIGMTTQEDIDKRMKELFIVR